MQPNRQRITRLLFLAGLLILSGVTGLLVDARQADAYSSYLGSAETQYPGIVGKKLDSCQLCHPSGGYTLNSYASDYRTAGHSFTAIDQLDSDKDGFSNVTEINALTWPGDANDHPGSAATNTPTQTSVPSTPSVTPTPTTTSPGPANTPTSTATNTPPPGATPTRFPLPTSFNRLAFVGEVSDYAENAGHVGTWKVSGRTVRVSQITWLEQPGLLGERSRVWVLGLRAAGGAVDATYIRILTEGRQDGTSGTPTPTRTQTPPRTPSPTPTKEDDDSAGNGSTVGGN